MTTYQFRDVTDPAASAWFVVYTSPQGERFVRDDLDAMQIPVFLPVARVLHRPARHRRNREKRIIERPLFPRYLFVGVNRHFRDFEPVRATKRVLEILADSTGRPVEIPYPVIEAMQGDVEVQDNDAAAIRLAQVLRMMGRRVRIEDGPFKGLQAEICRASRKAAQLLVHGEAVSIRVDVPLLDFVWSEVSSPQDDQQKRSALRRVG